VRGRRDTARPAEQRDRGKMCVVAAEDGEIARRLREQLLGVSVYGANGNA
jgi:hypothetical protein